MVKRGFSLTASIWLRRARSAAGGRDWVRAANAYRRYVRLRPEDGPAWIQFGHALKEQGELAAAVKAYETAVDRLPETPEAWFQLGHARRLDGGRAAAIAAFERAVLLDADFAKGIEALLSMGARDRLSPAAQSLAERPGAGEGEPVYALSRYPAYRRHYPRPLAPAAPILAKLLVVIDGREASNAQLRATVESVLRQTDAAWRMVIVGGRDAEHPAQPRSDIVDPAAFDAVSNLALETAKAIRWWLIVDGGTELAADALGWYRYASDRSAVQGLYCDHDHVGPGVGGPTDHSDPLFQPCFDPLWFRDPTVAPALVMVRSDLLATLAAWTDLPSRQALLFTAAARGGVAHIPLLLASSGRSYAAPPALADVAQGVGDARIQVIIQTRDASALLASCVDTLHAAASRPQLLDVLIIDNRSRLPETHALFAALESTGVATVLGMDEEFNWSRANNIGAAHHASPILLFLNNDTETITQGWDELLRRRLNDPVVGVVGARLLYPDRSIQHAGIVLGSGSGGPVHEGVARDAFDPGPCGRLRRTRAVAAVTGAWLGMRRETFEKAGRFDERLPIAFNDVDLCLRVRSGGSLIVEDVGIVVIHHESATRGLFLSEQDLDRERRELLALQNRWGADLVRDPGYNPHWTAAGAPHDGLRYPSPEDVIDWIDRSCGIAPWRTHLVR